MKNNPIPPEIHSLLVNQKKKTRIPTHSIIMLEGYINYTIIHLQNGKQRLYARTLGYFEALLSQEHFIRVHRGYLVNTSFIVEYNKDLQCLHLQNNIEVRISRRKRGITLHNLNKWRITETLKP
ncbi:MAG: LytTR family transcriptional regulator [Arcicella sp.]|jgi:two-component system, LytTR family, response regulator|nr:LytTR family transcriptional regulator [Arcicella sp.]